MRFSVFISGLVCSVALLSANQANAISLDQFDADHLSLSQESPVQPVQKEEVAQEQKMGMDASGKDWTKKDQDQPVEYQVENVGMDASGHDWTKGRPKPKEKMAVYEKEPEKDDCDKLGDKAAKCRGERNDERRKENERKDKEWRLKQSEYYRNQQEQIRIKNQEQHTKRYWETYEEQKSEEERIRQEKVEQQNKKIREQHEYRLKQESEERKRQYQETIRIAREKEIEKRRIEEEQRR